MDIRDENGTTVLRRKTDYKPPRNLSNWLIGRPLPTADAPHQTVGKLIGLAIFASDALSSTAYATQEMMVVLAVAGIAAFSYSFPIAVAIVILLAVVSLSYEQIVHAYPDGGGSYIVSRDNLGEIAALVAAASLLTDYILTVSVSVSSGVAQLVSAFPVLFPLRSWIAIGLVLFVMMINLRGVRESGAAFSIPTYLFILMMLLTLVVGLIRYFTGTLGQVVMPPESELLKLGQPLTFFLILRAFANGTSALTGVEAISNGITAFKEPRSRNAGITLIWLAVILGVFMLGITFLSHQIQAIPAESETVISQLARTAFAGRGILYFLTIGTTTVILIMATNTAFNGFPRLSAIVAIDGFLPRQLAYRGSRLVYSYGIVALAAIASVLIFIFQASVTNLIPLYAIGVFMSFTLSQGGMAHRWWKSGHQPLGQEIKERGSVLKYEKNWQVKMVINGLGCITTAVVAVVFAVTKFTEGAYIVIILIPIMVAIFFAIHKHYRGLAAKLSLENYGAPARTIHRRIILPIGGVHRGTLSALRYARTLSDDVTAVHVSIDPEETEKIQKKWEIWGDGVRLVILDSPYRLFIEPLLEYVEEIYAICETNEGLTIVVPQFIPKHPITNFLHTRTADTLRKVLLYRREIAIIEVPYQVD